MSSNKVIHDRSQCIGCGSCVTIAPQNWAMDETDGKARLIGCKKKRKVFVGEIFDCDIDANKMAVQACPMRIIKIGQ